ncbi:hypothetical protein CPC08DRAFT_751860 [Agrocybe pediades]|nr:hypothetical protein CPC08DRAFT_751860 [Agrocybe pediades]
MRIIQWDIVTALIASLLTEVVTACSVWIMSHLIAAGAWSMAILLPGGLACTFPPLPPMTYSFWIPFTTYESILCVFALYRGYRTFTSSIGLHGSLGNRLLRVMIRDSISYFIILTLAYLSVMLVWVKLSNSYILIPGSLITTLCNVLSNRMILNIRDTASKPSHVDTNASTSDFAIEFSVFPVTPRRN